MKSEMYEKIWENVLEYKVKTGKFPKELDELEKSEEVAEGEEGAAKDKGKGKDKDKGKDKKKEGKKKDKKAKKGKEDAFDQTGPKIANDLMQQVDDYNEKWQDLEENDNPEQR